MESIEKIIENYAVVFNVNLDRATLNEAVEFKNYLAEAIKDSDKDLIINLSACEHLDSTFLGVLVSGYKKLKSQNRNLVIIEPIDQSSIFLTLNSIGKIFPLYTSVKVALEDIQNKKLLEKEINDLSTEETKSLENPVVESYSIDNELSTDESVKTKSEESKVFEMLPEKTAIDVFEAIPENDQEVLNKTETEKWSLTEHKQEETITVIPSDFKMEESIIEEKSSELESVEDEESQVTMKHSRDTEKNHFSGSAVKWEFGFSS